jgi:hypothetical protein
LRRGRGHGHSDGRRRRLSLGDELVDDGNEFFLPKRLPDSPIGAGATGTRFIAGFEIAENQENRDVSKLGRILNEFADLVAVAARHRHIREDEGRFDGGKLLDGRNAIGDGENFQAFASQDSTRPPLMRRAVICN